MSSSRCHPSFHESEKLINIQTFIFLVDFYVLTAVHRSRGVPYYHSICIHVYAMSLLLNLVVYGALTNSHITYDTCIADFSFQRYLKYSLLFFPFARPAKYLVDINKLLFSIQHVLLKSYERVITVIKIQF